MSRLYCTDLARQRGDDNSATASRVDLWILVELPVTWGRDPIRDAAIPKPVVAALKHANATIPRSRIVFIRKRVECLGPTKVYVVRTAPKIEMTALDLPSIHDVATLDFVNLPLSSSLFPLVLVCTHGQHDSCCGRRGYPLFDALRKREELEVWQCSHIGGDRFAANAVVLPWGLYYGPVEPHEANALADTIATGEIYLSAYRGRSTMSRHAQAAETFVRRATGLTAREALRVLSRKDVSEHQSVVRLRQSDGTLHEVTIEHYIAGEVPMLTCTSTALNRIPQFRLLDLKSTP